MQVLLLGALLAGVATADLPFEKEEFTWKSYAGPWFGTNNMAAQGKYDVVLQSKAVLAGEFK